MFSSYNKEQSYEWKCQIATIDASHANSLGKPRVKSNLIKYFSIYSEILKNLLKNL